MMIFAGALQLWELVTKEVSADGAGYRLAGMDNCQ